MSCIVFERKGLEQRLVRLGVTGDKAKEFANLNFEDKFNRFDSLSFVKNLEGDLGLFVDMQFVDSERHVDFGRLNPYTTKVFGVVDDNADISTKGSLRWLLTGDDWEQIEIMSPAELAKQTEKAKADREAWIKRGFVAPDFECDVVL